MDKFLKDYIKMYAKCNHKKINKKQLKALINDIFDNDELWEMLDNLIEDNSIYKNFEIDYKVKKWER